MGLWLWRVNIPSTHWCFFLADLDGASQVKGPVMSIKNGLRSLKPYLYVDNRSLYLRDPPLLPPLLIFLSVFRGLVDWRGDSLRRLKTSSSATVASGGSRLLLAVIGRLGGFLEDKIFNFKSILRPCLLATSISDRVAPSFMHLR